MPPLAALALVVLFFVLGFWQLDRADQKRALQASFDGDAEYLPIIGAEADGAVSSPLPYQRITARGRYLVDRQFLIDNMVVDGRLGYYVITPLELSRDRRLLLVNRGWIAKSPGGGKPAVPAGDEIQDVEGRAGQLPRVGVRPGEALENAGDWPKLATFPTTEELASALGREVLPFVLLADPDPATGLVRSWAPQGIGPGRHLAYAFQWFALAIAVVVVTVVVYRKKGLPR